MLRSSTIRFILAAQFFLAISAFGQGGYKIDSVPAPSAADIPAAVQSALQTQGERLTDDKGNTVSEVWLRKEIPAQGGAEGGGAIYGGLEVGEWVGVLHFPGAGSDFRGQNIKPGYYTMRYALEPEDGNHMGVSVYRDFVLLGPVAQDAQVGQTLKFDDLVKLSRQASGTNHPAVLSMVPVSDSANPKFPALLHDGQSGYWVLQVKSETRPGGGGQAQDYGVAIIVVGKAEAS